MASTYQNRFLGFTTLETDDDKHLLCVSVEDSPAEASETQAGVTDTTITNNDGAIASVVSDGLATLKSDGVPIFLVPALVPVVFSVPLKFTGPLTVSAPINSKIYVQVI